MVKKNPKPKRHSKKEKDAAFKEMYAMYEESKASGIPYDMKKSDKLAKIIGTFDVD